MFAKFTLVSATIFSTLLFVFSANASNEAEEGPQQSLKKKTVNTVKDGADLAATQAEIYCIDAEQSTHKKVDKAEKWTNKKLKEKKVKLKKLKKKI